MAIPPTDRRRSRTALSSYERLEATGYWRAHPGAARREVIVSIGEATLTLSDLQDRALTHWSLAAVDRQNPEALPALYSPDGDPGETLELAADETAMIEAIEILRNAISRGPARSGQIRRVGLALTAVLLTGLAIFWLPGALIRHTATALPDSAKAEISDDLLAHLSSRASGVCEGSEEAALALRRLAVRMGTNDLVVLNRMLRDSLHLPDGRVVLNGALLREFKDPAVIAGVVLAEKARVSLGDPLADLLDQAGLKASLQLLTSGGLSDAALNVLAASLLTDPPAPVPHAVLLAAFEAADLPSRPYALAKDATGETVLPLIEADPMAGKEAPKVVSDRDWILLQGLCDP